MLLVCPNAAAEILSDIPSNLLHIPLSGFPSPPVIILHSLSSSFSNLHSAPGSTNQETMTKCLLTGFVLDHPGSKDLVLEGENWKQPLEMPHDSSAVEKSFLFSSWQGETGLWDVVSSGLVETCSDSAGGCTWRKESIFL